MEHTQYVYTMCLGESGITLQYV